ncbi:MAG: GAF domain-containing protein [Proteobacteria bacterium]|nr:GAF domain-containing protein [Pseudomonadota bacterium]
MRRVEVETALALSPIDQHVLGAANLADLIRGVMAAIGGLDSDVRGMFARADATGQLQIEASFGVAADRYHQAMEAGMIPKISIDPEASAGQGPGRRAWRSGQIVATDAWALEPGPVLWRSIGSPLGFRSSAAVPLLDASGRSIALLVWSPTPGRNRPRQQCHLKHDPQTDKHTRFLPFLAMGTDHVRCATVKHESRSPDGRMQQAASIRPVRDKSEDDLSRFLSVSRHDDWCRPAGPRMPIQT